MTLRPATYMAASQFLHDNGLNPREWTNLTVVAESLARGYDLSVDPQRERVLIMAGGKQHWWKSGLNSLNPRLLMRITKNKEVASKFLRAQGHPVVENAVFRAGDARRAWDWAEPLGLLVIKPSDGTWGTDVHVGLADWEQFERAFTATAENHAFVIVEPQIMGEEYRFAVVEQKVIGITRMEPAHVIGDGQLSIARLVKEKNKARIISPIHRELIVGSRETATLKEQGYSPSSVPAVGEKVYLRRTANLQTMGDATDATDAVSESHIQIIEDAAGGLPRGRLLGFDVLIDERDPNPVQILEVNSGPMISIQHLPLRGQPRDVAGAVLNSMFPKDARPLRDPSELVIPTQEILQEHRPSWASLRRVARRVRGTLR